MFNLYLYLYLYIDSMQSESCIASIETAISAWSGKSSNAIYTERNKFEFTLLLAVRHIWQWFDRSGIFYPFIDIWFVVVLNAQRITKSGRIFHVFIDFKIPEMSCSAIFYQNAILKANNKNNYTLIHIHAEFFAVEVTEWKLIWWAYEFVAQWL